MSRRFSANLVIDSAALDAFKKEERKKIHILIRRMQWLRECALEQQEVDPTRGNRDVQEYAALHWVLEMLGVVKFENSDASDVAIPEVAE